MLLRRIARPLFATWFVAEGVDAVRSPAAHVEAVRESVTTLAARVPVDLEALAGRASDQQLTLAVRVHGVAMAVAGLTLAAGKAPRTAATVLALLTAPMLVRAVPPPRSAKATKEQNRARRARAVQTLTATGGALLAAADTEGRPGVRWRAQAARAERAARQAAGRTDA
ncbi:MAG: DoxX family protein [Micrococcales bacterium]|nr:DoxX family protein [Micrococcales bacterium]